MTATTIPTRSTPPGWTMLRIESRLFMREPVGLVWGLALPVIAFVVLGCIPALTEPENFLGGVSFLSIYQPVLILISLALLALNGLPQILGSYRERGVLRRLQATPMPPARLLGTQLVIHLTIAVIEAIVILTVGALAFGVPLPHQLGGWLLAYLLACVAMLSLGVLIAAVSPNGKIANVAGTLLFFPIAFFAGLWMPRPSMPQLLGTISDYTPLGAAIRAMAAAAAGQFPPVGALGALAGFAAVFCILAVRLFRWN